jgi:hypothetical protein
MSIRPVDLNGMIQRTQDVGNIKHAEDNKPVVEQHTIQVQQQKQEERLAHKVQNAEEKENAKGHYDAREKGSNSYEKNPKQKNQKKHEEENSEYGDGKVIFKGQRSSFDMKI